VDQEWILDEAAREVNRIARLVLILHFLNRKTASFEILEIVLHGFPSRR